jgi:hypothetical protein
VSIGRTRNEDNVGYPNQVKSIYTLIPDIYQLLKEKKDGPLSDELVSSLSLDIGDRLRRHFNKDPETSALRLSRMGPQCPKALWYSVHAPEQAEDLPPWAKIKYAYGHIIESLAIALAKAAGHHVEGEQDEIILDGVVGHRDCVIDGCTVDVKSTSSRGFLKFKDGSIGQDDSFGYLDQLDGYVVGSSMDPLVLVKDRGYILAIDKQLGHMALYEHKIREEQIRQRIRDYQQIVSAAQPPACMCGTRPMGKGGNIQLDVKASYSPFKHICFPSLRTFLYSDGPVYLTHVERVPDVPELRKT